MRKNIIFENYRLINAIWRHHNATASIMTRNLSLSIFRFILIPFAYSLLLLMSCSENLPEQTGQQSPVIGTQPLLPNNFYKRLEGTIGGAPVTLHLTAFNGWQSGFAFIKNGASCVSLAAFVDSILSSGLRLDEMCITERQTDGEFQPYWMLEFQGDSVKGYRIANALLEKEEILMQEKYPRGSHPMEQIYHALSANYQDNVDTPYVTSTFSLLWPIDSGKTESISFLTKELARLAGCEGKELPTKYDILRCITEKDSSYFSEYRRIITEMDMESEELTRATNNHSRDIFWDIISNDNDLLTLEIINSEYTGGAHGNYSIQYVCLDSRMKKIWTLSDIMQVDSAALSVLLDIAARKYFNIREDHSLQDRLLVAQIQATDNVYITPKGLVFCYQPYEIASYADGVIQLYIPYRELWPLLQPEFIERIKLNKSYGGHVI